MSTATATSKPKLETNHREWLKKMGVALDTKISAAPTETPTSPAADSAAAPAKESPPSEPSQPISVEGKPVLKKGSKGQDVKDLQTLLNKNGAKLEVDGDFGKLTEAAVKEFQKANPPLVVDGVVGKLTWAALGAKQAPPPPPPPDTKPRRAIFLVTDAATNDAVADAAVKIGDQSEKTGNTGQATFSLPPGKYPFGVAADGFEQAIGTFEVSANDESQMRVELKGGERRTKTVLTVSPSGKSDKGVKLELIATVTAADPKIAPSGTIRFDVVLNGSSRQMLATVPVKDGKAVHSETKLPKGKHSLDATFTPNNNNAQGSQSAPVPHEVQLTKQEEYEVARKAALAKLDDCLVSAREFGDLKTDRDNLEKTKKEMEAAAKSGDFDKAIPLANKLGTDADAYLKSAAEKQKAFDKKGADINKALDDANFITRDDVAREVVDNLKPDDIKFLPTPVRNRLMEELQSGIFSDDDKKAMRKLFSEKYLDPEFEKIDKANQAQMITALKADPAFKEARSKWSDPSMTAEKKLATLQKAVEHQAKAYGFPPGKIKGYDRTKEPSRPKYGYYDHDDGTLYVNIEDAVLTGEGFDEAIDTAIHENAHRYQGLLIDRLEGKAKPEIKPGDPLYDQALTFKLNDTKRGFYVFDGAEYGKQPQENHSRLTHDVIKDAEIGK